MNQCALNYVHWQSTSCYLLSDIEYRVRMEQKMKLKPTTILNFFAFSIFMIQAYQSLNKYFLVVIQELSTNINTIEKPTIQICFNGFYDYEESSKNGYMMMTDYFVGRIPNSSRPTWKAIDRNLSFETLQQNVHEQDFSQVEVSILVPVYGKGFCLQIQSNKLGKQMNILSKKKNLSVFLVHNSTDTKIMPVMKKT